MKFMMMMFLGPIFFITFIIHHFSMNKYIVSFIITHTVRKFVRKTGAIEPKTSRVNK